MENSGRTGFYQVIEARIAEWDKTITLLGHRMAKAKDDPELKLRVEEMKGKLPVLAENLEVAMTVQDEKWSDFKSEVDLTFEHLVWLHKYVMRKLGSG